MALQEWALPELSKLLPLDKEALAEIVAYAVTLPDEQATEHFRQVLGDSPEALDFIIAFNEHREALPATTSKQMSDSKKADPSAYSMQNQQKLQKQPPAYMARPQPSYTQGAGSTPHRRHTNAVIEAANVRARDEVC